jgi:hypothetical protein
VRKNRASGTGTILHTVGQSGINQVCYVFTKRQTYVESSNSDGSELVKTC